MAENEPQGGARSDERERDRPVALPDYGRLTDSATGISMRFVREYDIQADLNPVRITFGIGGRDADDEPAERAGVPCGFCIRMVGRHCREHGCLHEAYRRAAFDVANQPDEHDLHRLADDGGPCHEAEP